MNWKPELLDMIKSVAREIEMRKNIYPKWVASGRMNEEQARREIQSMEAVLGLLELGLIPDAAKWHEYFFPSEDKTVQ